MRVVVAVFETNPYTVVLINNKGYFRDTLVVGRRSVACSYVHIIMLQIRQTYVIN